MTNYAINEDVLFKEKYDIVLNYWNGTSRVVVNKPLWKKTDFYKMYLKKTHLIRLLCIVQTFNNWQYKQIYYHAVDN